MKTEKTETGRVYNVIRENKTGRVRLLRYGRTYAVEIAGEDYGPFTWREACDWYARHKGTEYRDDWRVELTDTFSGEPNYSWAKRATFTTRAGASQRAIVREAKRALDLCGRWDTESYGDTYTLRARGACLVAFITPVYP